MPSNRAAWIMAPKESPLVVKEAPFPSPGPTELVVRVHAVAINPLEYKIQDTNPPVGGKAIEYPTIFGADTAGIVVEAGDAVKTRKTGDRVIANPSGLTKYSAAFQEFVAMPEHYATPVPDNISFDRAVVLPLACDTASAGLFMPERLGLSTSAFKQSSPTSKGLVLIWGGSSSVGCCAIQLASAAGYEVFTTASKRNHALCSSLGAARVFDHTKADVEDDIIVAFDHKNVIGALDCISSAETIASCVKILSHAHGSRKVVTVLAPPDDLITRDVEVQRLSIPSMLGTKVYDEVHEFLAKGLADGRLQTKPDPQVIGDGLDSIQLGIDTVRKGVSAAKVVVRLVLEE